MDLIIYWRFESPGRISDLMLYFHLSHRPYKCTPLNPRYAPIAQRANHRCEYCKAPEVVFNFPFEVEHIIPLSQKDSND